MSPNPPAPPSDSQHGCAIAVRPMCHTDIPAVAALMVATPLWQRHGLQASAAALRLERGLDSGATIQVAVAGSLTQIPARIGGFVWYVARGAFQRSGYVMLLGVAQDFQRHGVGRRLMECAETALFAEAGEIFLLVSDFNTPAQRFYAALGYTQIGAIPEYVTVGVNELIYFKRRPLAEIRA